MVVRLSGPSAATTTIFEPPFLGSRVVKGIPVADIAEYVNETALICHHPQAKYFVAR